MFVVVFGAGVLAMVLRAKIPDAHLVGGAQDAIRQALTLVATMTALVLGLLLASAQQQFAGDDSTMTEMAARLVYLDRLLAAYGPDTRPEREALRHYVQDMHDDIWPQSGARAVQLDPSKSGGRTIYDAVEDLSPQTAFQHEVKTQVLEKAAQLAQMRWLLFERANVSLVTPFVVVVICWLALIFFGYGLFAPANATVVIVFIGAALSVSSATFLILDLGTPFEGMIRISSQPIETVLTHLGH